MRKEKEIQSVIGKETKRKKGRRKKTEKIEERGRHVEVYREVYK